MQPLLIHLEDDKLFTEFAPVVEPVSETVSNTRTALHQRIEQENVSVGVWECTPGDWRRQVLQAEYSYFISGTGAFIPDVGEPVNFKAGDAIYFAPNTQGTWSIKETVRKHYIIIE
ncbi:hypothetical protein D3C76_833510 [compost metagenome]